MIENHKTESKAGEQMIRIRGERKMTQGELARATGVTQRMISAVERGERLPSVALAMRIEAELGIKWTAFFADPGSRGEG